MNNNDLREKVQEQVAIYLTMQEQAKLAAAPFEQSAARAREKVLQLLNEAGVKAVPDGLIFGQAFIRDGSEGKVSYDVDVLERLLISEHTPKTVKQALESARLGVKGQRAATLVIAR